MENLVNLSENLKSYFTNRFLTRNENKVMEDYFWIENVNALQEKPMNFLKLCFPQLCFPIEDGINKSPLYKDAVLKGKYENIDLDHDYLNLNEEDKIYLFVYKSFAGNVPVLVVPEENDFTKIIKALLYKSNPVSLPNSMGASLINGINNWQKINLLKKKWQTKNDSFRSWNQEFKENVLPFPSLFKDKIIVLSKKNYSGVSDCTVSMSNDEWQRISFSIRLEHECTHLYTLNNFGVASNNLHDELIADYIGITKAIGYFNKEWMLLFMGLENYPSYRRGARLENYVKDIEITSDDFLYLKKIIKDSIENISRFDFLLGNLRFNNDIIHRLETLCKFSLLDISSKSSFNNLLKAYYYSKMNCNLPILSNTQK